MVIVAAVLASALLAAPSRPPSPEELFDAARSGDAARVAQLLDAGVDVNAKGRYDVTALTFAADKGHLAVVRLLVEKGADVNVQDTFYKGRAIVWAVANDHLDVAQYLAEQGSKDVLRPLFVAIEKRHHGLVRAASASAELTGEDLEAAVARAVQAGDAAILDIVKAAAAAKPATPRPVVTVPAAVLKSYEGSYRAEGAAFTVTITATENGLRGTSTDQPQPVTLVPRTETSFTAVEVPNLVVTFGGRGGTIETLTLSGTGPTRVLARVIAPVAGGPSAPPAAASGPGAPVPLPVAARTKPQPWPAFRGRNAAGVADGQGVVAEWDVPSGRNIRWKTPIPGIAVSSPIVWGDRVFVTTAVGKDADKTFRTGLYGDVAPVNDLTEHTWKLYALDRRTGKVAWERDVFTGTPKVKRHPKSSQANSTPVTDGRRVVAVFGSIGQLAGFDIDGRTLWKRDIGVIDSGWFFDPTYQWGHSSSPVIYGDTVIVQADQQKGSYVAAFDLDTGRTVWRAERPDEIPTWGTPTILSGPNGDELVTNGSKVRGYDPKTGKLLWTLAPNSEVTVGTPVMGKEVIYVTGGYPPVRPVYAIRPGARGEISAAAGQPVPPALAWSNDREGTYIPSPLYYRDILYTLGNNGVLTAYKADTGEKIYRTRVGAGGSFSASPVAADGRLYLTSEDGDVIVIRAGPEYAELGRYAFGEVIMATPALSDGLMVVRTMGHVYGIGPP